MAVKSQRCLSLHILKQDKLFIPPLFCKVFGLCGCAAHRGENTLWTPLRGLKNHSLAIFNDSGELYERFSMYEVWSVLSGSTNQVWLLSVVGFVPHGQYRRGKERRSSKQITVGGLHTSNSVQLKFCFVHCIYVINVRLDFDSLKNCIILFPTHTSGSFWTKVRALRLRSWRIRPDSFERKGYITHIPILRLYKRGIRCFLVSISSY